MKQLAQAEITNQNGEELDPKFHILNRWTFLMMQVFECKKFLDLAEEDCSIHPRSSLEEVLIQQALFRSAILAYGKCFADSGKGRSSLDKNKVFAGHTELVLTHERLMDLRHKFAAHNDHSGLDEAVIDVEDRGDTLVIANRYAIANPMNEYEVYRKAIAIIEDYVVVQMNKAIDSLERQLGKKIVVRNT